MPRSLLARLLDHTRGSAHDSGFRTGLFSAIGEARELLLNNVGKFGHLVFHLNHFFAHVQDNLDAGEIHPHVAGESQDDIEPLEVRIGIEACVALRARGLEQTNALVEAQGLRVQLVDFRNGADHVAGLGAFFVFLWHGKSFQFQVFSL